MKIVVDKQCDTLYLRLDEERIVESEQIRPGVILDYDENDRVVGVEFLDISTRPVIWNYRIWSFARFRRLKS
jgi:uncharacterized protein YuzE